MENRTVKKYNPAFLSKDDLVKSFVVRIKELELILKIISDNNSSSNQHVLVIGPRGVGKTTLVLRVAEAVRRDERLNVLWHPIIFSEESYKVTSAGEFWLEAIDHLSHQDGCENLRASYDDINSEFVKFRDSKRLEQRALSVLLDFADSSKKRLLIIVENFQTIIGEQFTEDDGWSIRKTLLHESRIMLLATASSRFDELDNLNKPMYELFRISKLSYLDEDECQTLWKSLTGNDISYNQIKPIHIITGGNPRLIVILSRFEIRKSFNELMDDLLNLVDEHSEYFRSHLEALPATERKVYISLLELWDPSSANEIAQQARLDVSQASASLKRLIGRGMVSVLDKRKTRYQVVERLFNIYYLLRKSGSSIDSRVRVTINFIIALYDKKRLLGIAEDLAKDSAQNEYSFYACQYLLEHPKTQKYRDELIKVMPKMLKAKITSGSEDLAEVKKYEEQAFEYYKKGNLDEAEKLLQKALELYKAINSIEMQANTYVNLGLIYQAKGNLDKAVEYFNRIEMLRNDCKQNKEISLALVSSAGNLANSYGEAGNLDKAVEYFNCIETLWKDYSKDKEISQILATAAVNLTIDYVKVGNLDKVVEYFDRIEALWKDYSKDKEISLSLADAALNLAASYGRAGNLDRAVKCFDCIETLWKDYSKDKEISLALADAAFNLVASYGTAGKLEKAVEYFDRIEALWQAGYREDKEISLALAKAAVNLTHCYRKAGNLERAEGLGKKSLELFEKVGDIEGQAVTYSHLGSVFYKKDNITQAEQFFKKAFELSAPIGFFNLALIYLKQNKSDELFNCINDYLNKTQDISNSLGNFIKISKKIASKGHAQRLLEVLQSSQQANKLEPLIVALRLYLGEDVTIAAEILEIAKDIVKEIKAESEKKEK